MHEGLKGKHIEGKYNPDLSSQIWVSYISDINKIFLFQDMCKGKPMGEEVGGFADAPRIDRSQPDTVFNSQLRTGVKLITSRRTQFKADFGGKI